MEFEQDASSLEGKILDLALITAFFGNLHA
jgi:hypothetical protein